MFNDSEFGFTDLNPKDIHDYLVKSVEISDQPSNTVPFQLMPNTHVLFDLSIFNNNVQVAPFAELIVPNHFNFEYLLDDTFKDALFLALKNCGHDDITFKEESDAGTSINSKFILGKEVFSHSIYIGKGKLGFSESSNLDDEKLPRKIIIYIDELDNFSLDENSEEKLRIFIKLIERISNDLLYEVKYFPFQYS